MGEQRRYVGQGQKRPSLIHGNVGNEINGPRWAKVWAAKT